MINNCVSLSQRTDLANALGAAHYHSIHSDAATMGSPANSTLIMWGQLGIGGPEKTPYGGKKMSQYYDWITYCRYENHNSWCYG